MHYKSLVIGNVDEQLYYYWEGYEVEPYEVEIENSDIQSCMAHYSLKNKDELTNKLAEWFGAEKVVKHDGTYYYESTSNQDSFYDWYEIGGRWSNRLLMKNGAKVDSAYMNEIDWKGMENSKVKQAKEDWKKFNAKENRLKNITDSNRKLKYECDIQGNTLEEHIKNRSEFSVATIVWEDRVYHEPTPAKVNEILSMIDKNDEVSIVDYHC